MYTPLRVSRTTKDSLLYIKAALCAAFSRFALTLTLNPVSSKPF
jgi:hypothetical protein